MKELLLTLSKGRQPKYRRLADGLRGAIREGQIKPGEVLPSSRELARRFRFNRHTVMNALSELAAEGWIESKEKIHYQVVSTLPSTFLKSQAVVQRSFPARELNYDFARAPRIGDYVRNDRYRHAFPSGHPDPRLFPMAEFKSHVYDALNAKRVLLYGDPAGESRLLEQISTYLRRVRNVSDRSIVVTNGSQEAIFLLAQLLVRPGDNVAVEGFGYPPALEALRFSGANLVPIRVDEDGLVVDDLEKQLKRRKIRLLYTTPLHQYPTTVTLSATRRLQLYELAYKHNILILEDDYDHEFHYSGQPVEPLASFDPGGLVLYVSTFSKILFPSARVGFMAVPRRIGDEIARLKRISSRQNESLLQETIARWMESGGFERHLRRMRRTYDERLRAMIDTLTEIKSDHPGISWTNPNGGMALWLNTGIDSEKLARRARENGVLVYPEANYLVEAGAGTHLRLGFSGQTPAENRAGLQALFSVY